MTAKVYLFPGRAILTAFHELHAPTTREAEELAASVLIGALSKAEVVPAGTLNLLLVTLRRRGRDRFGMKLAEALSEYHEEIEVLVTGQHLLRSPVTRPAGLLLLRLCR